MTQVKQNGILHRPENWAVSVRCHEQPGIEYDAPELAVIFEAQTSIDKPPPGGSERNLKSSSVVGTFERPAKRDFKRGSEGLGTDIELVAETLKAFQFVRTVGAAHIAGNRRPSARSLDSRIHIGEDRIGIFHAVEVAFKIGRAH